jgi:hypothetical protein
MSGFMGKLVPPRFNEGWGTWHAKIYGADDDLIISGCALADGHRIVMLIYLIIYTVPI